MPELERSAGSAELSISRLSLVLFSHTLRKSIAMVGQRGNKQLVGTVRLGLPMQLPPT